MNPQLLVKMVASNLSMLAEAHLHPLGNPLLS